MASSPITCHVLDSSLGRPGAGVQVKLEQLANDGSQALQQLATGETNADGRCPTLLTSSHTLEANATYKLTFETGEYFKRTSRPTFYPKVEIWFQLSTDEDGKGHYHVPLLLSPFGYTTYRGS